VFAVNSRIAPPCHSVALAPGKGTQELGGWEAGPDPAAGQAVDVRIASTFGEEVRELSSQLDALAIELDRP
jgi:hypothetical protein